MSATARAHLVTNISDLTPAMRNGLRHWNTAVAATRRALILRGLVVDYGGTLTDAGQRAVDKMDAESSAAAVDQTDGLYLAIRGTVPALTDVARYVAQLRRWATSTEAATTDWDNGWRSACNMIAGQLEKDVLRDLAPLLMPEAVRLDAAAQRTPGD